MNQPVKIPVNTAVAGSGRVIADCSIKKSSQADLPRDSEAPALFQAVDGEPAADLAVDPPGEAVRHWFSRSLAMETGIPDAIVLRFLSFKITRSKNQQNGKPWFYDPVETLAERFPYLTVSALEKLLQRNAKAGRIERGNFNRQSRDRTTWYTMSPSWLNRAEKDLVGFYVDDAVIYGLSAAVLIMHLQYQIGRVLGLDPGGPAHCSFSPTQAAKYLPMSKSTIERSIRELEAAGVFSRHRDSKPAGNTLELGENFRHRMRPIYKQSKPTSPQAVQSPTDRPRHRTTGNQIAPATSPVAPTPANVQCDPLDHRLAALIAEENEQVLATMLPAEVDRHVAAGHAAAIKILNDLIARKAIRQWSGFDTHETALKAMDPHINSASPPIPSSVVPFVREFILRAFLSTDRRPFFGNILMMRQANSLRCKVWGALEQELQADALERFEEHRRDCESLDADKEPLVDITPAEKARVLRNAINAQNNIGILTAQRQVQLRLLTYDRIALEAVERFYAVNPAWNVAILVEIMVRCDDLDRQESDEKFDNVWHARQGKDLKFLLCQLDRVIQGLGMSMEVPPFTPVAKAILFPGITVAEDSADHTPKPEQKGA